MVRMDLRDEGGLLTSGDDQPEAVAGKLMQDWYIVVLETAQLEGRMTTTAIKWQTSG